MPNDLQLQLKPDGTPAETADQYFARVSSLSPATWKQYIQPGTTAAAPAAPVAPATPAADPEQAARDATAKELGYTDFNAFTSDVMAKPSKSTEQLYQDAFNAAGLSDLQKTISSKRSSLNAALGVVNDNPWYDEAFRRGEASRLQTLANGDISNLEKDYNDRLTNVHDLVSREAADLATNQQLKQTKLTYLENRMKEYQTQQAAADKAKAAETAAAAKPQTITAPTTSNIYQFDPATKTFNLVQKAIPKPVVAKAAKAPATTAAQKTLSAFQKALANKATLLKAGTREQFARQLQAQFPEINPDDIQRKIYEVYPDSYNK